MSLFQFLKSKTFFFTLLKMFLLALVLIFMLKYWLGCSTNHNQKIEVPDLSKMSVLIVKTTLEDLDLKYVILDTVGYNPKFPPLTVVAQNPEVGEFVKERRKIYISLNRSNYQKIEMPKLLGKTKRHVESELQAIGFKLGTYSYIPDRGRNVVRGMTYKGKPISAGAMIPKNAKINLILGDGKGN